MIRRVYGPIMERRKSVNSKGTRFRVVCRTMKAKQDIAESGPVAVEDDDIELTPKEEAAAANHLPPDEHGVKIEKKLEHDAAAANRLPQTEQLAKFEKKLEHDDSGNQPS